MQQPFDEHEPDVGFAQPNTIAQQGTAIGFSDFHNLAVALALVGAEHGREQARVMLLPGVDRFFLVGEVMAQRLRVDGERRVVLHVAVAELDEFSVDVGLRFGPASLKPLSQERDFGINGDAIIQFDVLCQARLGKVA